MALIRTLVCAIDFSRESLQALRVALAVSRKLQADIVAVHVIEPLLAQASAVVGHDVHLQADTEKALHTLVEAEWGRAGGGTSFAIEVRCGIPEREVLACAHARGAELILVGARGSGKWTRGFLGSVAEKVLRRADVAVIAVPCPAGDDNPPHLSNVLAAVDVAETSKQTAVRAADLASQLDLPLKLIHVVPPLASGWKWTRALEASTALRMRRASSRLNEVAQGLTVRTEVDVRTGSPAEQIAAAAKEHPGTLVVLGLDAAAGVGQLGSTAYRIVCLAETPVLAVPIDTREAVRVPGMELAAATGE